MLDCKIDGTIQQMEELGIGKGETHVVFFSSYTRDKSRVNFSDVCIPWQFPALDHELKVCDPMQALKFNKIMMMVENCEKVCTRKKKFSRDQV